MGKIYKNKNQLLLSELIKIYEPIGFDWLNYQITKKNTLTIHHVVKVADGGILCVANSALLTKRSHRVLHICEARDYVLYTEINDFFREIIQSGKPLSDPYMKESSKYKMSLVKTIYR